MKVSELERELADALDQELAAELIAAYEELKTRYFAGDFRPSVLEGGRFAEATFRILQLTATGKYTPLDRSLPGVPRLLDSLESAEAPVHDSYGSTFQGR